jgi:hypothetical protein
VFRANKAPPVSTHVVPFNRTRPRRKTTDGYDLVSGPWISSHGSELPQIRPCLLIDKYLLAVRLKAGILGCYLTTLIGTLLNTFRRQGLVLCPPEVWWPGVAVVLLP